MFDCQVSRNNVYKVETIGDAYMVVGGLFGQTSRHASDVANQALDMMECATRVRHPKTLEKGDIQIRVGIHSGEVMSGVVGMKMPRYCLFGNTVNVASRTETNGQEGKINVSSAAYDYLRLNPDFKLTQRGFVEMKGVKNGGMICYFLESTKIAEEIAGRLVMPPKDLMSADRWVVSPSRRQPSRNQPSRSKPSHGRSSLSQSDKMNGTTDTRQKLVSCQTLEIPGAMNFQVNKPTLSNLRRGSLNPELSSVCPLSGSGSSTGISIPVPQHPSMGKDVKALRKASVNVKSLTVPFPQPFGANLLKRRSTYVSPDNVRGPLATKNLHKKSLSVDHEPLPHPASNGGNVGHFSQRTSDKVPPNHILGHLKVRRASRYSSSSSSLSPLSPNRLDGTFFAFDEEPETVTPSCFTENDLEN
jgi:hypothetical protein